MIEGSMNTRALLTNSRTVVKNSNVKSALLCFPLHATICVMISLTTPITMEVKPGLHGVIPDDDAAPQDAVDLLSYLSNNSAKG
jgi:hypothetical protein